MANLIGHKVFNMFPEKMSIKLFDQEFSLINQLLHEMRGSRA